jgi:hydroxymethylpyrimidine pyrophosphatase-like HAD family hydrolase
MGLSVLALDYDGTIARNERVPPPVLDASRKHGVAT